MREGRTNKKITGSTFAKIVAYILLTVSAFVGIAGCVLSIYMFDQRIYTENMEGILSNGFAYTAYLDSERMGNTYIYEKNEKDVVSYCNARNIEIFIEDEETGEVLFSSVGKSERPQTPFTYEFYHDYYVYEEEEVDEPVHEVLLVTVYVDKTLSQMMTIAEFGNKCSCYMNIVTSFPV